MDTGCRGDFCKLNGYLQNIKFGHGVQGAKPPCKIKLKIFPFPLGRGEGDGAKDLCKRNTL